MDEVPVARGSIIKYQNVEICIAMYSLSNESKIIPSGLMSSLFEKVESSRTYMIAPLVASIIKILKVLESVSSEAAILVAPVLKAIDFTSLNTYPMA